MKKHIPIIIILIILSLPIIRPLLTRGYFSMHDDTQVARVIVMGKAIRNSQFPVRWVSDLGYGYGYPLYNFYGPLPYYVGGFLYAAGSDAVVATKMMMVAGMMLAGVTMYVFVQARFGRLSGLLAGILYAYAPYHAVELYVRGAVGELWAYAFLPLLFVRRNHWIAGLTLAAVILSHTISGYVTVALYLSGLSIYSLILLVRNRFHLSCIIYHLSVLFVGLGFSAFFWLPAIAEMQYTNVAGVIGATADFHDHFVCVGQFWNSLWGFAGSAPGCVDGMSFKIGKLHVLLGGVGVALAVIGLKGRFWKHPVGLISMIGTGGILMATSISQPVWEIIPGFAYIQYPWRFLTLIVFSISIAGSSILLWVPKRFFRIVFIFPIVLSIIILNAKLFVPQVLYDRPDKFFESEEELRWRVSGISDEYLPRSFIKPKAISQVAHEIIPSKVLQGLRVETEIYTETYIKLVTYAQSPIDVAINLVHFPGWNYWVNGAKQSVRTENGLPILTIPSGRSVVEMHFTDTPVRTIGNIISILVVILFFRIYGKKTIA